MARERGDSTMQIDRWSYLWLAIGALFGFVWTIPLTVWLGSIFMLRFVCTQKVWRGVLIVWLVSYATMGITLRAMLPFPLPMYLVTMALSTLLTGALPYLADRLLAPRLSGFVATLVFPHQQDDRVCR